MINKKRILVFSDFDSIRNVIVKSLIKKGYNVVETKTYDDAEKELNGTSFGLIITDNDIKNKDSLKLIEYLRGLTSYLSTPIILLHSSNKEQLLEQLSEFRIACLLNKPFPMEKFYSVVDRFV